MKVKRQRVGKQGRESGEKALTHILGILTKPGWVITTTNTVFQVTCLYSRHMGM